LLLPDTKPVKPNCRYSSVNTLQFILEMASLIYIWRIIAVRKYSENSDVQLSGPWR